MAKVSNITIVVTNYKLPTSDSDTAMKLYNLYFRSVNSLSSLTVPIKDLPLVTWTVMHGQSESL